MYHTHQATKNLNTPEPERPSPCWQAVQAGDEDVRAPGELSVGNVPFFSLKFT